MKTEKFTFPSRAGRQLAGALDLPDGPLLATAVLAHCFTCTGDLRPARRISARLTGAGIAVLRFDFTGLGECDDDGAAGSGSGADVGDILAACEALAARGRTPTMLIGHSLAGAAVLRAGATLDSIKAVVTIAAPHVPDPARHKFTASVHGRTEDGSATIDLGGRPFAVSRAFLDEIASAGLGPAIRNLHAALLVMHAPLDDRVGIASAQAIFAAARHPKSFVTLDDADHLLSRPEDAEYAADVIAAWARRYLRLAPPAPPPGAPEGIVRVNEADPEGFLQDIQAGPWHHCLADEPVAYGGTNRGMSPYGFLSAGLGACTSMTIRMYAQRKKWPLAHVRVDVSHAKIHAEDAATGTSQKIDTFHRRIHLEGDLDASQRARLVEIADKCPVHRTLRSSSRIETTLAED